MSESYEPSYYEIALTGRQVLVAFVILLVCLVAAFFSGVWVGRDAGAEAAETARTERPEQAPGRSPEAAPAEEAGEARPEALSFFEEQPADRPRDVGETAREPTDRPRAGTTLREDLETGGSGEEPEAKRPAPEAARDAGTGPEAPRKAPAEAASPRRPGADAHPSGSLATGDVVIQVLVSSEEDKAREVLGRLERSGFRAFLSPVVDGGRTLYRVRVGPFEEKAEAERVAEELRRQLNLETWVTQ